MVGWAMWVPGRGLGLMSEPIAKCGESAANALLPAAPVGMPPPPPPYPPPPPHAARPSKEDNITEVARGLRVRILILLSVTIRPAGTPASKRLTVRGAAPFRVWSGKCR